MTDTIQVLDIHFKCPHSRRLPGLAVQAVATALSILLERSIEVADDYRSGGICISMTDADRSCVFYDYIPGTVDSADLDRAVEKVAALPHRVDNYIFVTTDRIKPAVAGYAATLYAKTGGTEFVVLDCLGFLRHFLHLFHR